MGRRSYDQFCGLARALDLVGERWTLLIVRDLLLGPLRYTELLRGLPGITTNLLAKRLKELEEAGIVERVQAAPGEGGHAYRLTEVGAALEPAVHALGRWGWRWMGRPRRQDRRSLEWLMVALRRRYRGGEELEAEVVADDVPYRLQLKPGHARIARGTLSAPDVRLRGGGLALAELFLRGWPGQGIEVEGSREDARRLVEAFERGEAG